MSAVIDALAQWEALAQREVAAGYQVKPSSTKYMPQTGQNTTTGCPSAWRQKIAEWCFQVVDHYAIGRDVVSYAMSYFDRIVPHYNIDDKLVKLVAMTCLYIAVKVHCSKKISPESMVALSRGSFQHDQVVKMERIVLQGLNWHVNPATSHLFLEIFFSTSSSTDDNEAMTEIKETACYLLELAVCDSFFINMKPSSISRAAILTAMDIVARPLRVHVMMANLLNRDKYMVEKCSLRLQQIYTRIVTKQDTTQEIIVEREGSPTSAFSMSW